MIYRFVGDTFVIRFDPGDEIMECLARLCEKENIRFAQVQAIGAVDSGVIGVFDLEKKTYYRETLSGLMEMTNLSGNITRMDGKPYIHLHVTLADQSHAVHGGHALELHVTPTCEMFVRTLDMEMDREHNDDLGINVWKMA